MKSFSVQRPRAHRVSLGVCPTLKLRPRRPPVSRDSSSWAMFPGPPRLQGTMTSWIGALTASWLSPGSSPTNKVLPLSAPPVLHPGRFLCCQRPV